MITKSTLKKTQNKLKHYKLVQFSKKCTLFFLKKVPLAYLFAHKQLNLCVIANTTYQYLLYLHVRYKHMHAKARILQAWWDTYMWIPGNKTFLVSKCNAWFSLHSDFPACAHTVHLFSSALSAYMLLFCSTLLK